MTNTNDVEPVLQSILEKGSVLQFNDYTNTVNYDVVLRTKLSEGETPTLQCDNWVAKFSAVTNSHWIVKNTSPFAVRVLYKKSYTCKNKKCNAKINIIFKKNNRNTRKNDPLLAKGLNAVVKIIFKHNHEVYCPALGLSSNKIETKYENKINTYQYENNTVGVVRSPEIIKCEDNTHEYTMEESNSGGEDNDSDDCKSTAHAEALKLINAPIECDSQMEVSRFKGELQRISNIVEDTRTPQMTHYLKKLNATLEGINDTQQFYEKFTKIFD